MRLLKYLKITIFLILILYLPVSGLHVYAEEPNTDISGEAAIVIDLDRGQVLFEKYADRQFPGPMISKLMTTLIASEGFVSNTQVTVSTNAAEARGDNINLEAGNMYKIEDLISASILTLSDNTCTALYESIEPDPDKFVELMNTKAASLSLSNTLFSTPCGTLDGVCYTTARDVSSFMMHAFNIQFYKEVFCSHIRFVDKNFKASGYIQNNNEVLWRYSSYAKGGALVNINNDRVSTITYASRNDMNLLAIVISTPKNKYISDAVTLFDYCFNEFEKCTLASKGEKLTDIKVGNETLNLIASNDVFYTAPKNRNYIVNTELLLIEDLSAPIDAGKHMGTIRYTLEDDTKILVSLQAESNIYSNSPTINDIIEKLNSSKDVITLVIMLCVIEVVLIVYYGSKFISKRVSKK